MELRDYQVKGIEDMRYWIKAGKRKLLLVSPTGSGKTIMASSMIEKAVEKGKSCLFVAHRRELVMQCSRKLFDFDISHGIIMAGKSPNNMTNVQVASIQTFARRRDRDDFMKPLADLIILDEAHRSVTDCFKNMIEDYPNAIIIGLTATPCRNDGRGLGNLYEELVECGNIRTLTRQGHLVPNRIVAPTIPDLQGIKMMAGDYDKSDLNKRMNRVKLIGDIVTHWIKYGEDRSTVCFATSIAHSKHIASIFNDNGVKAGHIDGEMPETEREEQLELLNDGKIKVLSNCMVLTEGWDQPKVSCIIVARPTKSYPLYLQMIGRTLRPYEAKLNTLIIDHSGCVYEHGFPEDVPNWELKSGSRKRRNRKKEPIEIEKQPITCLECHTVYDPREDGIECPNCNWIPTKKAKIVLIRQGRLVEMPKIKPSTTDKGNFYAQLLYYCKQKGYKEGWASHKFKEKFGHFPHSKQVIPVATGKEVMNWIMHLNIKMAKSKKFNDVRVNV